MGYLRRGNHSYEKDLGSITDYKLTMNQQCDMTAQKLSIIVDNSLEN